MAFFEAFGVDVFKLAFQIINFLLILYLLSLGRRAGRRAGAGPNK